MRRVLVVGGWMVVVCLLVALVALRIVGLDPRERRPGLWLTGEVVTAPVTDWSFTDKHPTIYVQTRTRYLLPHSVTITCVAHDGQALPHVHLPRGRSVPPGQAVDQQRHARSSRPPEDRRSRLRPDGVARDRSGGTASGAREQGEEVPD